MNRILNNCFFVLVFLISKNSLAQTFWTETFGTGCTAGNIANVGVPTASNGAWAITNLAGAPGNGANANQWFVSATEAGMGVGVCGDGCLNIAGLTNRTLHIGSNLAPFFVDPGAAYLAGGANFNTNKRAESPTINCTGQTGISLSFKYLVDGVPGVDLCEAMYSINNGAAWVSLGNLLSTSVASCTPQGNWASATFALPATVNNNPTVKVGFRWQSSDPTGNDPSIAIDDVILFKPLATLSITTASTVCSGVNTPATISGTTAGTTSFSWTTNPAATISGTASTGLTGSINYPSAGVYTVLVVGFVGVAPTYSATQTVTVTATPTVAIAPTSMTICTGNTATLTANATAGSTLQWATGTIPFLTLLGTSATQTVSPAATTAYSVVAGIGTCTSLASVNVVIGANLSINGAASPTAACSGGPVTLSALGASNYTWVAPSGTLSSGTPSFIVVNPTVATTYTVLGSNAGCTGSTTIPVGITSNLSLTLAASSATTCPGTPVTLTASGATNYTWSPGSTLSATNGATVTATPSVATTYTVVGDNGAGCTGTANISVNMGSGASASVIATSTAVCAGYNATLTAVGASNYTWTGTGFGAPVNQPSVSVGPGVYSYTAGSGVGCTIIGAITIGTMSPLNVLVTQSSATTCIASNYPKYSHPVQLTPSGAGNYVWSVYDPATMSNSIGIIYVKPQVSTCYTVTGNTAVCSGSAVVCVTVIPQFTMSIIPKQPIMCLGDSLTLNVSNIGTLAVLPIQNYIWYDPVPPSMVNPYIPTVTIFPTVTCTYSVEIFDARACASLPRVITVTVLPQPLTALGIPTINGVPTNTLCYVGNQTGPIDVNLNLTAINNNPLVPGVVPVYTWMPPYHHPSPIQSDSIVLGSNVPVTVSALQFTSTGVLNSPTYLQTFTVVSGFNGIPGCRRVDTISIKAVDCRSVTIASVHFTTATQNDTLCSKDCITFFNQSDTASGGQQTYLWQFLGGTPGTSTLTNPTICYNLPGTYWVRLTVNNPYPRGSGSSASIAKVGFIKVVDIPNTTAYPVYPVIGQLKADTTIRFGQSVTLNAFGANSYVWKPNYNISTLSGPKVTVNPLHTQLYVVTGSNSSRCKSKDSVNVIVIDDCGEMFVPTAFSPNGDGSNDVLYVRGYCLETMNFMVFNRWGEKVFETTDIKKGWDGTYKGEIMNTGVFVYRLEGKTYDGKGFSSKGNITLVR